MFVLFFTLGFVLQIVYIGKHLFKILFNHHKITLLYLFCGTFWRKNKLEFWFSKKMITAAPLSENEFYMRKPGWSKQLKFLNQKKKWNSIFPFKFWM